VAGLVNPALADNHSFGVAITGGHVVRQAGSPVFGKHVFADDGSGRIWAIDAALLADGQVHTLSEATEITAAIEAGAGGALGNIASFGEGAHGELDIVDDAGKVVQVTADPAKAGLSSLSFDGAQVNAGGTLVGTIVLTAPVPVDTAVVLSSSSPAASVPITVVVPQGASSASFVLSGFAVVRNQRSVDSSITATVGAASRSATVSVLQRP